MAKIYIITGQTAAGKTEAAIDIASKHNGELVNCDSRQIYKHLDIISGKDLTDTKFRVSDKLNNLDIGSYSISSKKDISKNSKVWLYDVIDPDKQFSSFDYVTCAIYAIHTLIGRGKTPIIVGGTYFYLYHLLYGVNTAAIPPDVDLRQELEEYTLEQLQLRLTDLDRSSYELLNNSDKNNPRRLIRKIEILENRSNNAVSEFNPNKDMSLGEKLGISNLEINYVGLRYRDRISELNSIKKRVDERFLEGAIEEVKGIFSLGFDEDDPGLKTIGYQQLIQYIRGRISLDEATKQWIAREMQYAKRQYTFMKRDKNIRWIEV